MYIADNASHAQRIMVHDVIIFSPREINHRLRWYYTDWDV